MNKETKLLATVKKANEVTRFKTREDLDYAISEIVKCKRDIKYFAEKYFNIINLDTGLTTIKLYPKQKELLDFFVNEKRCIVLASRLSSKTTTYTIYALWLCMFHNEKKIMLLANKADTAIEILGRIRMAYEYCASFLKPGVLVWNKGEIIFSNNSAIKGFATASDAARGYSANVVIADEFSFVPNNIASKVFESIYPVISSSKNSLFIMVSTPNGADPKNLYYEVWQKANTKTKGENLEGWKAFRFDWWDVPGRDELWKLNTIASIGLTRFDQEFGNIFLTSATLKKLVSDDVTEKYRQKLSEMKLQNKIHAKIHKIISEANDKLYEFTMWHEFDKQRTYVASGDISEGIGGDDSVLYVWDITDLSNITMCAKFSSNKVSVVEFAFIINRILGLYGKPYFIAERNGCSGGTLDALRITYQYPRLAIEGKNNEPGVFSHVTVKGKSCLWTREMLTTQGFGFTIYDPELLDEWSTFVKKDTKGIHQVYQALSPAHDDHIMSFIWLCYMLQSDIIERYFIVVQTFTSSLGTIYAKKVAPLKEYTSEEVKAVTNDQVYKDFLDFKADFINKFGNVLQQKDSCEEDMFFRNQIDVDPYFNDLDFSPSWNSPTPTYKPSGLNNYNQASPFFFTGGGGFNL